MRRTSFFLVAFLMAVGGASCSLVESRTCTSLACQSSIDLAGRTVSVDISDPENLELTGCLNGECVTTRLRSDGTGGLRCASSSPSNLRVECVLARESPASNATRMSASLVTMGDSMKDGDRVSFTLVDVRQSGVAFQSGERSVVYAESRPNGSDCEPTCRSATLE